MESPRFMLASGNGNNYQWKRPSEKFVEVNKYRATENVLSISRVACGGCVRRLIIISKRTQEDDGAFRDSSCKTTAGVRIIGFPLSD